MAEEDAENQVSEGSRRAQEAAEVQGVEPDTVLVEFEPGIALVFGDGVSEGFDGLVPLQLLDQRSRDALTSSVSLAAGMGNVAAQGLNGALQAQGLVRLAPETLAALQSAQPMTSGGWNLGSLVSKGKIVQQVRWLPATSAGALSVVAAVGPAMAMIAIQFQLAAVTRLVRQNVELTSKVLQTMRNKHWAAVTGHQKTLAREIANAQHIGAVTEAVWENVRGQQSDLEAQLDFFRRELEGHIAAMRTKRGNKERQLFFQNHGGAVLADAHALILAQSSWVMYHALRAGHLLDSAAVSPNDEALLNKLVEDVKELNAKLLSDTAWLLEQVSREIGIMAELDGKRTFILGDEHKAGKQVVVATRKLQEHLASIRDQIPPPELPSPAAPEIAVFKNDTVPPELLRLLRFRLNPGESLLALADASLRGWFWAEGWVVVTSDRILVLKQDDFRRFAAIEREIPREDVRHVRVISRGRDERPEVDIVNKNGDVTLEFGGWASKESGVERLAGVIRDGDDGRGVEMRTGVISKFVVRCRVCGQRNAVPAVARGVPQCAECHTPLPLGRER